MEEFEPRDVLAALARLGLGTVAAPLAMTVALPAGQNWQKVFNCKLQLVGEFKKQCLKVELKSMDADGESTMEWYIGGEKKGESYSDGFYAFHCVDGKFEVHLKGSEASAWLGWEYVEPCKCEE